MNYVKLREDLALNGVLIPAFDDIDKAGVGETFLSAQELDGAYLLDDNTDETRPHYLYEHIQLKDGRVFYVLGIDLDYEMDSNLQGDSHE